jgi:sterol desaturase/sphingolipid hydroxylase (fatty acid hydroxylase superfamily)
MGFFESLFESWGGWTTFFALLPAFGIVSQLGLAYLFQTSRLDGFSFEYEVQFAKKNVHVIWICMTTTALILRQLAIATDWTRSYTFWDLVVLPIYIPVYLFLDDTTYYWSHRAMHRSPFLWKYVHAIHHSTDYSGVVNTMYASPFDVGCHFIGPAFLHWIFYKKIHTYNFLILFIIHLTFAFYTHTASTITLLPEALFLSPLHHEIHHKSTGNYAQYMPFWDWMMGTQNHSGKEKEYLEKFWIKKNKQKGTDISQPVKMPLKSQPFKVD